VGGQHVFFAHSTANENVLRTPLRVVYGFRWIRDLIFLAYVSESHGDNPAAGFLRTLWAVCEGPIMGAQIESQAAAGTPPYSPGPFVPMSNAWSGFVVNGQYVTNQHSDYAGIWGTPHQSATTFSDNVLNYPNTSVMRIDYGRADFRNFNPDGFKADAQIMGKKDVAVYTDSTTYTRTYTTNRAWCLLDLYVNKRYGLGIDISRFVIQDWIDLAAYCTTPVNSINESGATVSIPRTTFNADITEGKWSDHLNDICLAGMFTLPYYHQSKIRIGPLEVATPGSAPVFSDQGTDGTVRNIVFSNNQSTLVYSRSDVDSNRSTQLR
jgi:hypothetical protein